MMTLKIFESICQEMNLDSTEIKFYEKSQTTIQGSRLIMLKIGGVKSIAVVGEGISFREFKGDLLTDTLKICPLIHENRLVLNKYLSYTLPVSFGREQATFGVGDRLGLASPGHIRIISKSEAKPILAQQSKRELNLTGRNFSQVLDDASFAVFQEGYKSGFGADGDHLKNESDILEALNCGYTMITLDCSEQMNRGIAAMSNSDAFSAYLSYPFRFRSDLERKYLGRNFIIGKLNIIFTKEDLIRCVLIYYKSICFVNSVYHECIANAHHQIDFEISIDETESITTEAGHFFVASEILDKGVEFTSLAPRFIGEFQKGIDYIGDIEAFEKQFQNHSIIADHFGYKLSIHSGSDKFSIFEQIGKYTSDRLHIKTSGTSWLEAVALIADCNPNLYRKIHQTALLHFEEAKNFYYVTADLKKIPVLSQVPDRSLPEYIYNNDARQLLHITYGFILKDKTIKEEFYDTLKAMEEVYYSRLEKHIGRHLSLLGLLSEDFEDV